VASTGTGRRASGASTFHPSEEITKLTRSPCPLQRQRDCTSDESSSWSSQQHAGAFHRPRRRWSTQIHLEALVKPLDQRCLPRASTAALKAKLNYESSSDFPLLCKTLSAFLFHRKQMKTLDILSRVHQFTFSSLLRFSSFQFHLDARSAAAASERERKIIPRRMLQLYNYFPS
jgi:hypothetical protein